MADQQESAARTVVDVQALVEELRVRAARARQAGAYGDDPGSGPLTLTPGRPRVEFRPGLGYSSKPGIGKAITGIKQVQLRLLFHVLNDLAQQSDRAVAEIWPQVEAIRALSPRVQQGEASVAHLQAALAAEVAVREHGLEDIAALSRRMDEFERRVEDLQLGQRLARLERAAREAPAAPVAAVAPQVAGDPGSAPPPTPPVVAPGPRLDYESFEGRYRPEASVREHQAPYLEILGGRGRVLDVGCGRGELVDMLRQAGVDAQGIDMDPDFVALANERGLPVVHGDGIAHVAGLPAASVDGIMVSHVVEHLDPQDVLRLVHGAMEALTPGGVLIMETPNPESLTAGSVNFHRDLTHRRPIHPDTLAFVCESAGFGRVEILRLSPVPDAECLPMPDGDDPTSAYLRTVVGRLNALVYGFQDYAVVAHVAS